MTQSIVVNSSRDSLKAKKNSLFFNLSLDRNNQRDLNPIELVWDELDRNNQRDLNPIELVWDELDRNNQRDLNPIELVWDELDRNNQRDLNPIELVWDELDRNNQCFITHLWEFLKKSWAELSSIYL